MRESKHIRQLEKHVRELMRADRARYTTTRISQFGTMQITRQRLRPSVQWRSSGACPQCGGTGRIQNIETISLQALRRIKAELLRTSGSSLRVMLHPQVTDDFQNMMRSQLVELESMYNRKIIVCSDPSVELGTVRTEQAT
jgi:ribonuclease E